MELLWKAAAVALTAAVIGLVLKKNAPELGFALTLAAAGLALTMAARLGTNVRAVVALAAETTGLSDTLIAPVAKCVGIGVVTRLCSDLCADAGQTAAGSAVELCGAVCALTAALPLMEMFFAMIDEML